MIDQNNFVQKKKNKYIKEITSIDKDVEKLIIPSHYLKCIFSRIEPDSTIILHSCRTGKVQAESQAIAQNIASLATDQIVIASLISHRRMKYRWKKGKLYADFYGARQDNRKNILGRILNIFYKIMFKKFGRFGEKKTAIFSEPLDKYKKYTSKKPIYNQKGKLECYMLT